MKGGDNRHDIIPTAKNGLQYLQQIQNQGQDDAVGAGQKRRSRANHRGLPGLEAGGLHLSQRSESMPNLTRT